MPIDLKWVRQDPQQVEEWQILRRKEGGRNGNNESDAKVLVNDVLRKDETTRHYLQQLQQERRRRTLLLRDLRPPVTKNKNDDEEGTEDQSSSPSLTTEPQRRDDLLEQKKGIDNHISQLEHLWKVSLKETERALNRLASPVDLVKFCGREINVPEVLYLDESEVEASSILSLTRHHHQHHRHNNADTAVAGTRRALDLEQAFHRYTLFHFRRYSSWVQLPYSGIAVTTTSESLPPGGNKSTNGPTKLSPDRAHSLWGGLGWNRRDKIVDSANDKDKVVDSTNDNNETINDDKNNRSSLLLERSPPSITLLPTWIRLLVDYLPPKSIWGDKQLPAYTAVWSTNMPCSGTRTNTSKTEREGFSSSSFSLQLVVLTASSVVDARQMQSKLVTELINFYESLLIPIGNSKSSSLSSSRLRWRQVPPCHLHPHEWSRVEILVASVYDLSNNSNEDGIEQKLSDPTSRANDEASFCLVGWVSHWGDAASRACDMAFAGAGSNGVTTSSTTTKEYVHIVQASVVDSSTWTKMLHSNRRMSNTHNGGEMQVGVPPVVARHLLDPIGQVQQEVSDSVTVWLPWRNLMVPDVYGSKKNKKHHPVFGPLLENYEQLCQVEDFEVQNRGTAPKTSSTMDLPDVVPKFPPLASFDSRSNQDKDSVLSNTARGEALSCPFDFLFS